MPPLLHQHVHTREQWREITGRDKEKERANRGGQKKLSSILSCPAEQESKEKRETNSLLYKRIYVCTRE